MLYICDQSARTGHRVVDCFESPPTAIPIKWERDHSDLFFYFFNASDKVSICSCRGVGTRTLSVIKTNKFCWIALIFILVWLALLVDLSLFNFDQGRVFEGV